MIEKLSKIHIKILTAICVLVFILYISMSVYIPQKLIKTKASFDYSNNLLTYSVRNYSLRNINYSSDAVITIYNINNNSIREAIFSKYENGIDYVGAEPRHVERMVSLNCALKKGETYIMKIEFLSDERFQLSAEFEVK